MKVDLTVVNISPPAGHCLIEFASECQKSVYRQFQRMIKDIDLNSARARHAAHLNPEQRQSAPPLFSGTTLLTSTKFIQRGEW